MIEEFNFNLEIVNVVTSGMPYKEYFNEVQSRKFKKLIRKFLSKNYGDIYSRSKYLYTNWDDVEKGVGLRLLLKRKSK